ncbi:putative Tetratricopeptide repeat (TPR)-like superfamily protein [Hibiscus syriacus]|uniref:Tetratricopeptide repeat (TPR)-like superfamily protein n=1 Tax=Hibiscus syriacus TaxID=106335 RepID=A0A6A2Y756_HIBSY|nr:putative Tetratricopeptide repeat (TPR)-like superfamily protein [Hibiscus syriacus]
MFDPATKLPKSDFSLSKHMGKNYDSKVQMTTQSYRSWNTMGADQTSVMEEDDSGVSTPPLWGTNPSTSGKNINYRCLSPSSKAQAIARGQRELMEMVSRMPECCFELTLKDLVEHQDAAVESKQESCAEGIGAFNEDAYSKEKGKKNQKPQIKRSGSIDNEGFLLKMVFPFSLGSKSKNKKNMKRNGSNVNYNPRVSLKPTVSDESVEAAKAAVAAEAAGAGAIAAAGLRGRVALLSSSTGKRAALSLL